MLFTCWDLAVTVMCFTLCFNNEVYFSVIVALLHGVSAADVHQLHPLFCAGIKNGTGYLQYALRPGSQ